MKRSEPPSTHQFFLVTVVLCAVSFIPLIGWFSAFFLVCWLIAWILLDTRGFLSVTWRTILSAVLLCSTWVLLVYLPGPHGVEYETQFVTFGVIAFALSAFGLVRSIIVARQQDI